MTGALVEVDRFNDEWHAAARHYGVCAPLPSNWQTAFTVMVKRKGTYQLVKLIPAAMRRPDIDNRWLYYRGVVRNTR